MTGIITSIPPLVEQPPGNNSSNPAGLPGITYSAAIPILPQTWTGLQTFNTGSVRFAGSTSGNTFLNATAIASGTLTLPAATDTLVGRNTTDTLTNKTIDGLQNTLTNIPATSFGIEQHITAAGPVAVDPNAGIVRVDQAIAAPITLTMPLASNKTTSVLIADWKGDAGTNPITINLSGADKFPGGLTSWKIAGDTGSVFLRPIAGVGYVL